MSESKHTPGPWEPYRNPSYWEVRAKGGEVASICPSKYSFGIDAEIANARLIAAAPDLLAALEEIREASEIVLGSDDPEAALARIYDLANIAASKAKGEA